MAVLMSSLSPSSLARVNLHISNIQPVLTQRAGHSFQPDLSFPPEATLSHPVSSAATTRTPHYSPIIKRDYAK